MARGRMGNGVKTALCVFESLREGKTAMTMLREREREREREGKWKDSECSLSPLLAAVVDPGLVEV